MLISVKFAPEKTQTMNGRLISIVSQMYKR